MPAPKVQQNPNLEDSHTKLHLIFRFADKLFAIPFQNVEEVVYLGIINALPKIDTSIRGIMNLRGEALSVINSEHILGTKAQLRNQNKATEADANAHLIITNSARGRFGLEVDKALRVSALRVLPLPFDNKEALEMCSAIHHYAMEGAETILIFNPEDLRKGARI